jgi:hypothetical protein
VTRAFPRFVLAATLAALTLAVAPGGAAADDGSYAHHVGLNTGVLDFPPGGNLVLSLGLEYLPDVRNDLAGVRGELARLPTLGLGLGLSDNALFQITWPAFNRLRIHSQAQPPVLGRELGDVSTDWGDVTVATIVQIQQPDGRWPGIGFRFAAQLPNTNEKLGIGDNTTDVFASLLLASRPGDRFALYTDVGLGILGDRTAAFTQNDVLTYGVLGDWRSNEPLRVLAEITGRQSTHAAGLGTGSRSEARAGVEIGRGPLRGGLLLVHGLTGENSRGMGVSVNVSAQIAALKRRH